MEYPDGEEWEDDWEDWEDDTPASSERTPARMSELWNTSSMDVARYDPDEHHAAPVELCWTTRAGYQSNARWIFIRCCGALGSVSLENGNKVVRSQKKCTRVSAPAKMHPGNLELLRTSRSAVRKHGSSLPMCRWQCCKQVAIKSWDAYWDWGTECLPENVVSSGCCDWDPVLATRAVYVSNGVMPSSTTASPSNDAIVNNPVVNNPDSNHANQLSGLFDCDAVVEYSMAIARVALPLTSRTRGAGSGSRRSSSGLEQVVLVAELEVKVADVQPTQGFVCLDTFDTPKGKCNVFDVMLEMTLERKSPEWPPMRIARHPRTDTDEGGSLYCIDNHRLFMHKVLCVDSARATVRATEVAWMTEFECKLRQAPPKESDRDRHWRTDDEGIAAAREELNRRLDMAQALRDVSVGTLMRALAAKKDNELSQYREEMRSLVTRVDSVNLLPPLPSEVEGLSSTTASPSNDAIVNNPVVNNPENNHANQLSGLFDCDAVVDDSMAIARVALPSTSRTRVVVGGGGVAGGGGVGDNVCALLQTDVLTTVLALLSALELARLRRTCLSMKSAVDPIILARLIALRPWDTDAYGRAQRLYWLEGGGVTDGSCRFCRRALVATPCTNKYRCKSGRCSNKHPCKRIDRRCPYVKCDGWFEDRHGFCLWDLF
jgi:hypothetical protein